MVTTTYPEKKMGISKMEEFFTEDIVSTGDVRPECIFFQKL